MRGSIRLLAAVLTAASCAFGADVTGIWTCQTPGRDGAIQDLSFRFFQKGEQLSGKMYGDNASTPITDARIAGDQISFTVESQLNGSINKQMFTGTVGDTEIRLTRRNDAGRGNAAAAAKKGATPGRGPSPVLVLKRLA